MKKNALVIGGCGFIGSHVVDRLLLENYSVRVIDLCLEKYRAPLGGVDYIIKSYNNSFVLSEALRGIDVVYHLASSTVPSTSNLAPVADIHENLSATITLLEQMVKSNVLKIVFLSSGGTVYGRSDIQPVTENSPLRPICSYGIVKLAIEKYLYMFQELYGLQPVMVRPSNPFGPRQGHIGSQGVVSTFLHRIRDEQSIEVWGDGSNLRDFLYIDDLVEGCIRAENYGSIGPFNMGSGRGVSINEVIDIIKNVTHAEVNVNYLEAREYDVPQFFLDCKRAKADLGWETHTSLQEGIARMWAWLTNE